jgi:DNA-binding XRE family transcriptional regulator
MSDVAGPQDVLLSPQDPSGFGCGQIAVVREASHALLAGEVAERIGTSESPINTRERHRSSPEVRFDPESSNSWASIPSCSQKASGATGPRKSLGLSQEELARIVGSNKGSTAGWERRTARQPAPSAGRVARVLEFTANWLEPGPEFAGRAAL